MKIFYDTEFLEDGKTIELISIGMVDEDGQSLYRINGEFEIDKFDDNDWLRENVARSLPVQSWLSDWGWNETHPDYSHVFNRATIRDDVKTFILSRENPELWAWYGAYDHVVLAQLFGRMIDLPDGIPMWTNDLRQEVHRLGNTRLPTEDPNNVHNALHDAMWTREAYFWLEEFYSGK